ncbi:iron chaperone [Paenibacillus gansuensis]|uniref:Iron chaperone n=1 Tax=Paenibacillus gansuensis TaxID=306542 RepID=A0ABW5P7P7_9BACL
MDKTGFETTDQYISTFPPEVQQLLHQVRQAIREVVPQAEERISYQMPTFALHGNLVHFAAFKHHIGFYPGASGIEMFQHEFAKYKWAKGSVQFPMDEPLPLDLIRRITAFRVEENKRKAEEKRGAKKPKGE